jgi:hypothetical protein
MAARGSAGQERRKVALMRRPGAMRFYRRIGANELDAIPVCRGFVEAQEECASRIMSRQHEPSTY